MTAFKKEPKSKNREVGASTTLMTSATTLKKIERPVAIKVL